MFGVGSENLFGTVWGAVGKYIWSIINDIVERTVNCLTFRNLTSSYYPIREFFLPLSLARLICTSSGIKNSGHFICKRQILLILYIILYNIDYYTVRSLEQYDSFKDFVF